MTLVVITSQLAGCATMSSDKTLKSMQESPDVSAEHTTPGAGDMQYMADSDSDAGLIEDQNNQKLEEISHDELIVVFEQQYEISKEINNSDSEETIQNELEMIRITVECMEKSLPSDYEVQYREWRPSVVQQDTQTIETTQQPQNQQSQGQQGQSSKPQGSQTQQPPQQPSQQQQGDSSRDQGSLEGWESFGEVITDPSQIASGTDDPYSGYGEVSIGYGG